MAGLRRYFFSDTPLRERLEAIFSDIPGRTISRIGQAPLGGSATAEWDFESPDSWRWHCGIVADDLSLDAEGQMFQVFQKYEDLLAQEFMTVADHCVRTWIYVRDIDHNYKGAVAGRKRYFDGIGLTADTHYIASTGIEGTHLDSRVLVTMDALAIPDLAPGSLEYLHACDKLSRTIEYGVTFERGVAFTYDNLRYTMISGTASIDRNGNILHEGDAGKQTVRILENIEALLDEDGAGLDDIASALVYLRNNEDARCVREILDNRLPCLDYLMLHAPVCRPGWLVEIECVAIRSWSLR